MRRNEQRDAEDEVPHTGVGIGTRKLLSAIPSLVLLRWSICMSSALFSLVLRLRITEWTFVARVRRDTADSVSFSDVQRQARRLATQSAHAVAKAERVKRRRLKGAAFATGARRRHRTHAHALGLSHVHRNESMRADRVAATVAVKTQRAAVVATRKAEWANVAAQVAVAASRLCLHCPLCVWVVSMLDLQGFARGRVFTVLIPC